MSDPRETSFYVDPTKRSIVLPSMAADKFYSLAVRAYRRVDKDINAQGVIFSDLAGAHSWRYRPSATVAFGGDIIGTIRGVSTAQVIADLNGLTSDGILSRAEKQQVVLLHSNIHSQWDAASSKANQLGGLDSYVAAAFAAIKALDDYLRPLSPPWNDLGLDTPVEPEPFQNAFAVAQAKVADLIAMNVDRASQLASWSGIKDDDGKKPEDNATVGAPPGTNVGGLPVEVVVGAVTDADGKVLKAVDLLKGIDNLKLVYGDTASAGAYASAAEAARQAAVTAKDNAEKAFSDADGARRLAQQALADTNSQTAVATQAKADSQQARDAAGTARDQAQQAARDSATYSGNSSDYAATASGHASTAERKAGEADSSAKIASGKADIAITKAGEASVSAGNAATSEATAGGYKTQAYDASQVSAKARDAALNTAAQSIPSSFQQGGIFWTTDETAQNPTQSLPEAVTFPNVDGIGQVMNVPGTLMNIHSMGRIALQPGRMHEVSIKRRSLVDATNAQPTPANLPKDWFGFKVFDSVRAIGAIYLHSVSPEAAASGWKERTATVSTEYVKGIYPTAIAIAPMTIFNLIEWSEPDGTYRNLIANGVQQMAYLRYRDVTESFAAEKSAAAAHDSEASAAASSDTAGDSASAADRSANKAETKAGEASTSAENAASSEQNAKGAESRAASQAAVSARAALDGAANVANQNRSPGAAPTMWSYNDYNTFAPSNRLPAAADPNFSYPNGVLRIAGPNGWHIHPVAPTRFKPGRRYRALARFRMLEDGGQPLAHSMYVTFFDANGNLLTGNTVQVDYRTSATVAQGWVELTGLVGADGTPGVLTVPGAAFGRVMYRSSGTLSEVALLYLEDVESELSAAEGATASSVNASAAAASAKDSSESAKASEVSRQASKTSAGEASTSAANAALSEKDADGSRQAAATSQEASATARDAARTAATRTFPTTFVDDQLYFNCPLSRSYSPEAGAWVFTATPGMYSHLLRKGVVPNAAGKKWRVRFRAKADRAGAQTLARVLAFDDESQITNPPGEYFRDAPAFTLTTSWAWYEAVIDAPSAGAWIAPVLYPNYPNLVANVSIASLEMTDATSEKAADGSASAAARSESAAAASKKDAGDSAAAASRSETNASTSAGNANTSAANAATSERNAKGSENTASAQATLAATYSGDAAASMMNQGRSPGAAPSGWAVNLFSTFAIGSNLRETIASNGNYEIVGDVLRVAGGSHIHPVKAIPLDRARRYLIQSQQRVIDDWGQDGNQGGHYLFVAWFDAGGGFMYNDVVQGVPDGVYGTQTGTFQLSRVLGPDNYPAGAAYFRPFFRTNGSCRTQVISIIVEDVEAKQAAASSASAANDSAATAKTKADAAGVSAEAASKSSQAAGVSEGNASTYARNAEGSASTASGHASAASKSSETSASYAANAGKAQAQVSGIDFSIGMSTIRWPYENTFTDGDTPAGSHITIVGVPNEGKCLQVGPGSFFFVARKALPLIDGHTYRVENRARVVQDQNNGISPAIYNGFQVYDANGNALGNWYSSAIVLTSGQGWVNHSSDTTTASIKAVYPNGAYIAQLNITNYRDEQAFINSLMQVAYSRLTDVSIEAAANAQAGIAKQEAAAASASAAAASTSAAISAQVSSPLSNKGATFSQWDNPNAAPYGWTGWGSFMTSIGSPRVDGAVGRYSFRQAVPYGGAEHGLYTDWTLDPGLNGLGQGTYVIYADVTLDAGSFQGSGVLFRAFNINGVYMTDRHLNLAASVPTNTNGAVVGDGVPGFRYRFAQLVDLYDANVARVGVYCMSSWSGWGEQKAKTLTWHAVGIRPATPAEIAAGKVSDLQATVTAMDSAVTNLKNSYAEARLERRATVPGAQAALVMSAKNDQGVATSDVALIAGKVQLQSITGDLIRGGLTVQGSDTIIDGMLTATTGIKVGSGKLKVAIAPTDYSVSNGESVNFGFTFDRPPQISFGPCPVALGTGEVYRAYADVSTTGFVAHLAVDTAPQSTAQSTGAFGAANGGFEASAAGKPKAANGEYTLSVSVTVRNYAYNASQDMR